MNWQEVCEKKDLQDLPYKIELNKYGQIVMSPVSNYHGFLQVRMSALLLEHGPEDSKVITECSIDTSDGTKVPDVAWMSAEFWSKNGFETPFVSAPEICIEVQSPSNSEKEMSEKRRLYFEAGAKEVWICGENGRVSFYGDVEEIEQSIIFPDFPENI